VTADLGAGLHDAEVLIDFTRPAATLAHLAACRRNGTRMVIGTTGFTGSEQAAIRDAAAEIAIMMAPNMSVGVNVAMKLIAMATRALAVDCDIEVFESHHRDKVDAPSGTALKMGEIIAQAQGKQLSDIAVYARHGHTGARPPGSVGFSAIRGGDIVGEHTVMFAGTGERIEITHRSTSRANYAQGSLRAARFLAAHRNGLFDMDDVLGLS
jgi:4-hydroxy-tetrahydrodipicolinate reductase